MLLSSTVSRTSESTPRCTKVKPTPKIISGKWVLEPNKARYVLRGFEEDVKDEDVFASTTMSASVRMVHSQVTDLRCEGYTVYMKDGDVVYARPPPEQQPDKLDPEQRHSDLEITEKSVWTGGVHRWQDHLEEILRKCGFVANMLDTCLLDSSDKASVTRIPRGRFAVGQNAQEHQRSPC